MPTRERIVEAAVRLIGERGYGETTVGDIEEAAGLTRRAGAFYRHFPSKEAVLVEALDRLSADFIGSLALKDVISLKSIRAELLVLARAFIRHAEVYRPIRVLIQREGHKLPALRKAARRANAKLAAADVVPWIESALTRSGRRKADAPAIGLMIFGPVLVYFIAQDRGDNAFGIETADRFLPQWADHWAQWFARGARDPS